MSVSMEISARHARWPKIQRRARIRRFAQLLLRRSLIVTSLFATLVLGLYTQVYDGPHATWLARDASGALYAAAWCLGLAALRPTARPRTLFAVAFTLCFAIELSQLWHPHWLEVARATLPGRLVLGSVFVWSDLAYYAVGALGAALWLRLLPFRLESPVRDDGDFPRPMGVAR